jgi:histidine triad (HIT) family protein
MEKDIFCKIVSGEIPSSRVAEGDSWIAINDIHPQAPTHVLVIPKEHIAGVGALKESQAELAGMLLVAAGEVAKKLGLGDNGFRVIINHGEHGGQTVPHLHVHVLGGRPLGPKMVHI